MLNAVIGFSCLVYVRASESSSECAFDQIEVVLAEFRRLLLVLIHLELPRWNLPPS